MTPSSERGLEDYHRRELRVLLDHVRRGLVAMDAGALDEFQMDGPLHRYKRAAAELWKFCNAARSQFRDEAVRRIAAGETPDWWAASEPRARRERQDRRAQNANDE